MKELRRLDITWQGKEVSDYEKLKRKSDNLSIDLPKFIKEILKNSLKK
jgi:hypothetical protein